MNNTLTWYQLLRKPSWSPPSWLFGPVWAVLYLIITISFGSVFVRAYQGKLPLMIALPFLLNLIFNFAFAPLQFGLQNNFFAALDILLILGTLAWALVAIFPYLPWVTYVNIPYLLWVMFATTLQLTITYMNK